MLKVALAIQFGPGEYQRRLCCPIPCTSITSNALQFGSVLPNEHFLLHHVRPDTVVLNIGSNDLANLAQVNQASVLQMAANLQFCSPHQIDARRVIMCKVLYRTQRLAGTLEIFAENANMFNSIVRNMYCKDLKSMTLFNLPCGFMYEYV